MLKLQEADEHEVVRVATAGRDCAELLARQWLLTNERGGYASSSLAGCNTMGYHGLLIGSLNPPVNRVMALSACQELLQFRGWTFELSTFDFGDRLVLGGCAQLREFRRDIGAHFIYELEPAEVHKSVYLARDSDTVLVEYTFRHVREPFELILRPLVGLRDFHSLQHSGAPLTCHVHESGVKVSHEVPGLGELLLGSPAMRFESDPHWWYQFNYRLNRERGQYYTEDLWAPGLFRGHVEQPGRMTLWARFSGRFEHGELPCVDAESVKRDLSRHQNHLLHRAQAQDGLDRVLVLAADQFIARRAPTRGPHADNWQGGTPASSLQPPASGVTILAGFPWFADWGRDAFVALPGLLLATGRYDEARSVLGTFAAAVDRGMIPNHFDDRSDAAHFNSVDASLWFIHAAFEYLDATGEQAVFSRELLPAIRQVIEAYQAGTRFGIHADTDGLIVAGDRNTQLTWMDAKCDGIAFTPRYGKAVEVNALWHSVLHRMRQFHANSGSREAARYAQMAARVGSSFCRVFWNGERGYLNDTVMPDELVDVSLRPNQIFAVSLPYGPPLTGRQQRAVVETVERELLTPYGLRTLNRQHACYTGRYEGPPRQRDEAYHQGTVWPWLMGPFVEAYLRVHEFSDESRQAAARMLDPLRRHLLDGACLGSISEIFDGDPPHHPRGCPAQAWSVAEFIRVCRMTAPATP